MLVTTAGSLPSLLRRLSSTSVSTTLALLTSCNTPTRFHQVHARAILLGHSAEPIVATRLVEASSLLNPPSHTSFIFETLHDPNVFTWTAMVRSSVAVKDHLAAILYYDRMRSRGIVPYKFSIVFVLKACCLGGDFGKGRAVHGSSVVCGLQLDGYVRSALVNFYCKCGDLDGGIRVFEEVGSEKNPIIWNAVVAGCFANGDVRRGRELFDEMPNRDVASWNVAVNGYCKMGYVDLARDLFDEMPRKDLWSWSSMISGYVQSGRAIEALLLVKEMFQVGVQPDAVTLASALSACSQVGALEMGKWIHFYMDKNLFRHDIVLGTSLVDMYAKCGSVDLGLQVFHGLGTKNVATWNAMLCGLAMDGQGDHALALFKEMEVERVPPNDVTFVGVLSACSHIGAVTEGRRQFHRMCLEFRITPKVEHYGCMVDLLCRAGLMDEARELILGMPIEPNLAVLGAYLSACRIHGDLDPGEWFLRLVSGLDPGDGWCHVLLSNIYASRNQWKEVVKLRKLMKGKGVQKVPGCSCIEVNSVVHEFVMGGESHHNCIELFQTVDWLKAHFEIESS